MHRRLPGGNNQQRTILLFSQLHDVSVNKVKDYIITGEYIRQKYSRRFYHFEKQSY